MKRVNIKYYIILAILFLVASCENDDLPKANFDLDAITVFSGEVAHEKASLIWQAPDGDSTLEGYILKWSPNGQEVVLDASQTTYTASGLENDVNYKFSIQANYGEIGISGANEIELKPLDELNFTVLPGNQLAIAKWDTPNRNDISGYTLSWEPNGQEVTIASDKNSYQITDLDNDVEYTFNFTINYTGGEISNENTALATPGEIAAFLLKVVAPIAPELDESPMATQLVQFTYNPAYLPASTASSWSWDFGDGNTSTEENPQHTFANTGIYDVSIEITDDGGATFNDTQQVFVWGEKWSYLTGSDIKPSSAAIADDGTIYIGSFDSNIYALNPDGTLKWSYTTGARINTSPSIGADGTIYCGSDDDNMYALNPDGTLKWSFATGSNIVYSAPAIAADGTIYFGSDDDNLYALNPDGTQKWVFNTDGFNIRSTVAIAQDGTVYVGSDDGNLYALNPANGSVNWAFDIKGPNGGTIQSGIAIDSDGTIITGVDQKGEDGAVFAVNPDGTEKWSVSVLGRISVCAPAIANGNIYVGTKEGNNLLALNAANGSQVWSYITEGAIVNSSPAVDVNGVIYFGSWDDHVYAVNPDGTLKYKFPTGNNVWSSPAIGPDGTIYIGSYDDKIYALEMFAEGLANDVWPMFGKNVKHTSR